MTSAAYRDFLVEMRAVHARGVLLGLERMRTALGRLGLLPTPFAAVQVAGTNGKGSTVAMAEAITRAAGFRTGLFTSPHLSRYTERIRVGGQEIAPDDVARLYVQVRDTGVALTYFEISCLLAALAMAERGVELAWLETGLGGRLDAVTALDVIATGITTIGLDHTDVLGPTIAAIAAEKAAIARPGVPLVLGQLDEVARAVVSQHAAAVGAPLVMASSLTVDTALAGSHQHDNAAVAVALAQLAAKRLARPLPATAVARGLAEVKWPGRLEWLDHGATPVLLDCAHNAHGMTALLAALDKLAPALRPRVAVLSIVGDKDARSLLNVLAPAIPHVIVTRSSNPRALSVAALATLAREAGFASVDACDDALVALARAGALAPPVLVTGSIFLVGELRAALLGEPRDPVVVSDPPARPANH